MNSEKRLKRESLRIIVSEAIMVLAVVVLVVILALLVSGYWLNSDFEIERQGMLQISSIPAGASIEIDGDSPWFQRTNTSKVLSIGEHEITLTKDGYDSWSKTINIREGLLYRVRYPRLFLKERVKKVVYNSPTATTATISKDSNTMVLINNTSAWTVLNLEDEKVEAKPLDISSLFSTVSKVTNASTGLFNGEIISTAWSGDNEHLLLQSKYEETTEWVLINIKDIKNSINLTREFGTNFSKVRIFNNSASVLLALRDGKLYKISVPERQISSIIVSDVVSFDFYDQDIIFTAKITDKDQYDSSSEIIETSHEKSSPIYYSGIIKINEPTITYLTSSESPIRAYLSRFYDDKYIVIFEDGTVTIYKRDSLEEYIKKTLSFEPKEIRISQDGGFFFMKNDIKVAALNMEALDLTEWTLDSTNYGWLSDEMPYSVKDGTLIVCDFDGLNRRELSSNVSSHFPATITNNKWFYYFSDGALVRETIAS